MSRLAVLATGRAGRGAARARSCAGAARFAAASRRKGRLRPQVGIGLGFGPGRRIRATCGDGGGLRGLQSLQTVGSFAGTFHSASGGESWLQQRQPLEAGRRRPSSRDRRRGSCASRCPGRDGISLASVGAVGLFINFNARSARLFVKSICICRCSPGWPSGSRHVFLSLPRQRDPAGRRRVRWLSRIVSPVSGRSLGMAMVLLFIFGLPRTRTSPPRSRRSCCRPGGGLPRVRRSPTPPPT